MPLDKYLIYNIDYSITQLYIIFTYLNLLLSFLPRPQRRAFHLCQEEAVWPSPYRSGEENDNTLVQIDVYTGYKSPTGNGDADG